MDPLLLFLLYAVVLWVLPVWIGNQIGKGKNRTGWLWGLLLGWLGVLILAVLPRSEAPAGLDARDTSFITYRPTFVTGAIEPGFTYGFRTGDQVLLKQATGSDQWVEVRDAEEKAEALSGMSERVGA